MLLQAGDRGMGFVGMLLVSVFDMADDDAINTFETLKVVAKTVDLPEDLSRILLDL